MYLTENERAPLGGFFGFLLPLSILGAVSGALVASVSLSSFQIACWLIFILSIALTGRQSRWLLSFAGALVVTVILSLGIWGQQQSGTVHAWPLIVAWIALLALVSAIGDARGRSVSIPPAYADVFIRLVHFPILIGVSGIFVLLLSVFGVSVFNLGGGAELIGSGMSVYDALLSELNNADMILAIAAGGLVGVFIGGLRYLRSLIGAIRFFLVVAVRYVAPILVVIATMLIISTALNGTFGSAETIVPFRIAAIVLIICFTLLHQTGSAAKPGISMRLQALAITILLIVLLIPDMLGVFRQDTEIVALVISSAGAVCLIGVVSDLLPGQRQWMPAFAIAQSMLITAMGLLPLIYCVQALAAT